jgi:hypothetical protein
MGMFNCFMPKYLQLSVLLAATLFSQMVSATKMEFQDTYYAAGSTLIISLVPALPLRGQPFTIEVSGTWKNRCIGWFAILEVDSIGQVIKVSSPRVSSGLVCGDEYEPTPFTRSVVVPSSAWENIDDKSPLEVQLRLSTGFLNNDHFWRREFDLSWGLHEIPPQIGQGHWISDQRPFHGINVEQQGDTVLAYELAYHGGDGQPRWIMGHASFHGDATHGAANHVSWLNPSWNNSWPDEWPKENEMSFTKSSFGIEVLGVNRVRVFFENWYDNPIYKRYAFRLADNQLPVFIPDMVGKWNLYAFDNQNLEASFLVEFRAANKIENGWYRFKSIDDHWFLDCQANSSGEGNCNLTNEGLGITMGYDLLDFNGNYAKAPLLTSNTVETTQTGILLRAGFHLPVLDFQ